MARPLRFVYPGAVYHVMARGDGGKKLFLTDSDHLLFLDWLDGACKRHGWRIHAWVLMSNHFHLLLETPEPNLVSGMKWLQKVNLEKVKTMLIGGRLQLVKLLFSSILDLVHGGM
jgi:REP element-mobilizing transposase RayT